ncbi:hypothetical protein J3Q64DRAFT_1715686 [Phycomyces blakesleeanus]|uniref:Uncharacterized protein n=1 Tax=Phycomyces blakesleeanus TaxID=4837 RepID=A0ABR3BJZ9_PHYBL
MPMTMPMPMPMTMSMPWNDFSGPMTSYPMPFMPYTQHHMGATSQNPPIPVTSAPSDLVVSDAKDKPDKADKADKADKKDTEKAKDKKGEPGPEEKKDGSTGPPKPILSRSVSLSGVPIQRQRSFFGGLFGSSGSSSGKLNDYGKGQSLWDPVSAYVPIQDVLRQDKSAAAANSIQSAITSNQLSRKASRVLSQKAKELEKRETIWCYRPRETKLQEMQKVWVPFDLRNQVKLDKYMQHVAPPTIQPNQMSIKTVTAPLEIKDSKLPGTLLVLPHQGVAYHYKSMMSTKYLVLEIVSIPSNGEGNQLVVRQSDIPTIPITATSTINTATSTTDNNIPAETSPPGSKSTGKSWTSVFR